MDNRDRFDRVAGEDLCKFRDIPVNVRIQFRAEDDHDPILQELRMKPGVRKGYTVSRDQQIGIIEIRGCWVEEFELDRPLPEFGGCNLPGWLGGLSS